MSAFPKEETLWARYLSAKGLTPEEEKVISQPYHFNPLTKKQPRYYHRRAVDAAVEAVACGEKRLLLVMATGTGKTFTAFQIVWRLREAGKIEARDTYRRSVYGIGKKPMPYLLGITNLLLHCIDAPEFYHGNSLERNVRELEEEDRFDIILMNPPYGGTEQRSVQANFPAEMRSSETADLFMALATYRLKKGGRAAIIIPDCFLFGTDGSKVAIKKRLLEEFNLHTIVRLPASVFSPYTSITMNILFFENKGKTNKTWFYRVDMPKGYKHFSKTRPMLLDHFSNCEAWWENRYEIKDEGTDTFKARVYSAEELSARGYDFDLCGYPTESEEVLSPEETIRAFHERRAQINTRIDRQIEKIATLLEGR